jgi:transposase
LIPEDHPARTVWAVVQRFDLTDFLRHIRARGRRPGRNATDPQLLIALWLYAATRNVACGRELARLCHESAPYQWLCGGVTVNYHTLNAFRVGHEKALDDILAQMLAILTRAEVVSLDREAQDGTRVRACAGSGSFHRRETLEEHLRLAREHLKAIKEVAVSQALSAQQRAARQRAASEQQERLEQALEELEKVERAKVQQKAKPSKERPARASSTDPEARLMRMPDGGTRPAYNVQLSTDCRSRAVIGVEVTNAGSDVGQDGPMRAQLEERIDDVVAEQLTDGDYVSLEGIERAAAEGVTVYMPVPEPRKKGTDPYQPKSTDSEAVAEWRERMGREEAQAIYQERGSTIETVNGETKEYRGMRRLLVRGLSKARCVALLAAMAYNLVHFAPFLLSD